MDYIKYLLPWVMHNLYMYNLKRYAKHSRLPFRVLSFKKYIEHRKHYNEFIKQAKLKAKARKK